MRPKSRIPKKLIWGVVAGVAIPLLICVVGAVLLASPYVSGAKVLPVLPGLAGDHVLIAFPGRRGDDLYLLKLGQDKSEGRVLAEDVKKTTATFFSVRGDEHKGFNNAVFTSNGQSILYTACIGDEYDAVDVCQVRADGEAEFETLYEKAFLIDVRWDDIDPF